MACQFNGEIVDGADRVENDVIPAPDDRAPEGGASGAAGEPVLNAGGNAGSLAIERDSGAPWPSPKDAGAMQRVDAAIPISNPPLPPDGYVRAAVGVGYGGIRLTSVDGGRTWIKTGEVSANGGDDSDLLRAVTWGKNLWIAGGSSKWWVSSNGRDWQLKAHRFGIVQGLAFGNDMFLATEMDGRVHTSLDGETWTTLGNAGVGNHARVVFGNGLFAASGDSGATATSKDGVSWQRLNVPNVVAFCDEQFKSNRDCYGEMYNAGFYVKGLWLKFGGGGILQSDTGQRWTLVYRSVGNPIDDISIGWVPRPL